MKYAIVYEQGDIVTLAGTEFVVLDVERRWSLPDILFLLSKNTVGITKFGNSNNYAESALRTTVEEWLKDMKKKGLDLHRVLSREIDLTTLDGSGWYGELNVKAAPLTMDEVRKYSNVIPNTDNRYWLTTGWSGSQRPGWNRVLYIGTDGGLYRNYYSFQYGIRPALKISADFLNDAADAPDLSEVSTDTVLKETNRRVLRMEEMGE